MRRESLCLALAAMASLTVAGCGGGGGDDGPSGNTGTISFTVSPTSLTLEQGTSGTVAVGLTRGGGFDGAVSVSVDGLPAGVTVSVDPATLTGATTSATVTVDVAASVAPGNYTATVRGTATGVGAATVTYALTVTATPAYALSATPATLSIGQGGSSTATINVARTNFTGAVDLSLDAPPAGITGSFNPASATGNTSTLTVNVDGAVATGNYTLTVKGSATGPGEETTTIALTVTGPPDYSLSLTPAALNVAVGQAGNATVNIDRTNFTGAVDLSLENPPAGVTAAFNPASATGNTSAMTLSVANTVAPGAYQVVVKGFAQGVPTRPSAPVEASSERLTPPAKNRPASRAPTHAATLAAGERTTTLALTVVTAPTVTMALNPDNLTIQQGGSGQSTLTLTRTNAPGAVTPTAGTLPTGVTVDVNPTSSTGDTFTITVNIGGQVPASSFDVTLTGNGAPGNPTAVLHVTVTVPSSGQLEFDFCAADGVPLWFAVQDGNGPWTNVIGQTAGNVTQFKFDAASTTLGIAFVFDADAPIRAARTGVSARTRYMDKLRRRVGLPRVSKAQRQREQRRAGRIAVTSYDSQILLLSKLEVSNGFGEDDCVDDVLVPFTANVINLALNDIAQIGFNSTGGNVMPPATSTTFQVPNQAGDVWAFMGDNTKVFRGIAVPNVNPPWNGTIDRNTTPAVANADVTLTNKPASMLISSQMGFNTSLGSSPFFTNGFGFPSTNNVIEMFTNTPALPGQFWTWSFDGFDQVGSDFDLRTGTYHFGTFGPQTWSVPPGIASFTVTQPSTNVFDISGPLDPAYTDAYVGGFFQSNANSNTVSVLHTPSWRNIVGETTTYSLRNVDFSGVANYPSGAALSGPLSLASVLALTADPVVAPGHFIISASLTRDNP